MPQCCNPTLVLQNEMLLQSAQSRCLQGASFLPQLSSSQSEEEQTGQCFLQEITPLNNIMSKLL